MSSLADERQHESDPRARQAPWARCEASAVQLRTYLRSLRSELWMLVAGDAGTWKQLREGEEKDERADLDTLRQEVSAVYLALGRAYLATSGQALHLATCRVHGAPAYRPGPCDCARHGKNPPAGPPAHAAC